MFSKFIRLGAALSAAVLLASCSSGSGQAETQQSTPEGLFEGTLAVSFNNSTTGSPTPVVPAACTQNVIVFVNYAGVYYLFGTSAQSGTTQANQAPNVVFASSGTLSFSGGTAGSNNVVEVVPPNSVQQTNSTTPYITLPWNNVKIQAPNGTNCGIPITNANEQLNVEYPTAVQPPTTPPTYTYSAPTQVAQVNNSTLSPTFTGGYNTGINIAGTFNYPTQVDNFGGNTVSDFKSAFMNIPYNADYQGVQNLGTLAGTYSGTVATSQFSEPATFIFGPPSVPANSGNAYGVSIVSGTGVSGCSYSGTVSPLFKGNGYTMILNSGPTPCVLPNNTFAGLVYLNVATNQLYSFSPNGPRTDGVIFSGLRKVAQ